MNKRRLISLAVVLVAVIASVSILMGFNPLALFQPGRQTPSLGGNGATGQQPQAGTGPSAATAGKSVRPKPAAPSGDEVFRVVQAAEVWPKIIQAEINPPDVHVGDVQKLSVVVQDAVQITSVEAVTRTDNATTVVKLALLAGPTPPTSLLPQKYYVDENHNLAFVTPDNAPLVRKLYFGAAAEAAEPPQYTYAGEWTVKDTHDAKYYTTFVAQDALGMENQITLAWLDPCSGIPAGGNAVLGANCTVSTVDGVDNGNLSFAVGGYTLQLNSGATFVWNPGNSITLNNGGKIIIGAGGQLTKGYLWMVDADSDNYPVGSQYWNTSPTTSPVSNGRRRNLMNSALTADCYDLNANANPAASSSIYYAVTRGTSAQGNDSVGNTYNSYDYDCDGTETKMIASVPNSWSCAVTTQANCGPTTCSNVVCGNVTAILSTTSTPACGVGGWINYGGVGTQCINSTGAFCGTLQCPTTLKDCNDFGLYATTTCN